MITVSAMIISIIGGLNWLIVGLFNYNLISALFSGSLYWIARVIYSLVGLSSIWLIIYLIINKFNAKKINAIEEENCHCQHNR